MRYLTKSKAIASHRKMWRWIAEETLKQERKVEKYSYFERFGISKCPLLDCYCCEYAWQRCIRYPIGKIFEKMVKQGKHRCAYCPIDWGNGLDANGSCYSRGTYTAKSLYLEWLLACDYKRAAGLAAKIAELPEKEVKING